MTVSPRKPTFGFSSTYIVPIVIVLVVLGLAFWLLVVRPNAEGWRAYDQITRAILSLSTKCPNDVSRHRWAFCIGWTLHLHGNCGNPAFNDRHELQRFADELDKRVGGPVSMETIDWIWDEYIKRTRLGKEYSDKYRPTVEERLKELDVAEERLKDTQSYSENRLENYIQEYKNLAER